MRRGMAREATEKSPRAGDEGTTAAQSILVAAAKRLIIPTDANDVVLNFGAREVRTGGVDYTAANIDRQNAQRCQRVW